MNAKTLEKLLMIQVIKNTINNVPLTVNLHRSQYCTQ